MNGTATSPSHADQTQQGPVYFDRFLKSQVQDSNNEELPYQIVKLTRKEPGMIGNLKQESRKDLKRTLENLTKTFLDKREGKRNIRTSATKAPL
jgi:hypothetical protein